MYMYKIRPIYFNGDWTGSDGYVVITPLSRRDICDVIDNAHYLSIDDEGDIAMHDIVTYMRSQGHIVVAVGDGTYAGILNVTCNTTTIPASEYARRIPV